MDQNFKINLSFFDFFILFFFKVGRDVLYTAVLQYASTLDANYGCAYGV